MTDSHAAEAALDELLSRPLPAEIEAMRRLEGDILILGVSGKMGPSLARLARRASEEAGRQREIFGVARFADPAAREALEQNGIGTIPCDLTDPIAVANLPEVENVILMAGQKFGTNARHIATWATNVLVPATVAYRFRTSRIVAFSTGNVYPLWPVNRPGPTEDDMTGPVGEYAMSALGRERILEHHSRRHGTPMAILRLNYAVELRYGVLRDIADRVVTGQPIVLRMGYVNVIWQRDANAVALRALEHATSPPLTLNVTGIDRLRVRDLARRFADRFGVTPHLEDRERATALLSDATKCHELFGPASVSPDDMIEWVAEWVRIGGRSLGRPTHFEEREGHFER